MATFPLIMHSTPHVSVIGQVKL